MASTAEVRIIFKKTFHESAEEVDVHGDDSSDEDEINHQIQHYDLPTVWNVFFTQFKKRYPARLADIELHSINILFSFIAHAEGIKLLYAKEINAQHRKNKGNLLNTAGFSQFYNIFYKCLIDAIQKIIEKVFTDCIRKSDGKDFSIEEKKVISNEILQILAIKIDIFAKEAAVNLRDKLKTNLVNVIKEHFKLQEENLLTMIWDAIYQYTISKKLIVRVPLEFNEENLTHNYGVISASENLAWVQALTELKAVAINDTATLASLRGKIGNIEAKQTSYPHLFVEMKRLISNRGGGKQVGNFLKDNLTHLAKAYMQDIIENDAKNTNNVTWEVAIKVPILIKFLRMDGVQIRFYIKLYFLNLINNQIAVQTKRFFRKTLQNQHQFVNPNRFTFFTHLRLSNRSQIRDIKNRESAGNLYEGLINKNLAVSVQRTWKFICGQALEQQMLTNNWGRQDEVKSLGNYENLNNNMETIKKIFKQYGQIVSDAEIAKAIREVFLGKMPTLVQSKELSVLESETIKDLLAGFVYLLFGCEVVRNPAMAILNQMMLDLIINGQLSWANALSERTMPMAPKGATAVARQLHQCFANHMPYSYRYPGTLEVAKEKTKEKEEQLLASGKKINDWGKLITLEAAMFIRWLNWKKINIVVIDKKIIIQLINEITASFNGWFSDPIPKDEKKSDKDLKDEKKLDGLQMQLIAANAAGNDANLYTDGHNNPEYLYSMIDGLVLLQQIRSNNLHYMDEKNAPYPFKVADLYSPTRENKERVLLTNPYFVQGFQHSIVDDVKTIMATHVEAAKNNLWKAMPQLIIIPLLSGAHWYILRVEISYETESISILWDNPYGEVDEDKKLSVDIFTAIIAVAQDMVRLQNKKPEFVFLENKMTKLFKKMDQQGYGVNKYDCGPIIFSNIRNYLKKEIPNAEFAKVDSAHHTIPFVKAKTHGDMIKQVRAEDLAAYILERDLPSLQANVVSSPKLKSQG